MFAKLRERLRDIEEESILLMFVLLELAILLAAFMGERRGGKKP